MYKNEGYRIRRGKRIALGEEWIARWKGKGDCAKRMGRIIFILPVLWSVIFGSKHRTGTILEDLGGVCARYVSVYENVCLLKVCLCT